MIDDYFARAQTIIPCRNFHQTMDVIAKQAFKIFLGVPAETTNWKARIVKQKDKDNKEYTFEEAF